MDRSIAAWKSLWNNQLPRRVIYGINNCTMMARLWDEWDKHQLSCWDYQTRRELQVPDLSLHSSLNFSGSSHGLLLAASILLPSVKMPIFRGIDVSIVASAEAKKLTEYPHPDSASMILTDGEDPTRQKKVKPRISVYIPSMPGKKSPFTLNS